MSEEFESYLSPEELAALDEDNEDNLPVGAAITATVRKKAAAMAASGSTKKAIADKLKISVHGMKKLYEDEEFKRLVAEIGDDAVATSKHEMKMAIARMTKKAISALEANLDKKSLEAVKIFLKTVGLGDGAITEDKGTGFTLVLANQPKADPNTIVVKKEGDE